MHASGLNNKSFFKRNGLLIFFSIFMIVSLGGQAYFGYWESKTERGEKGLQELSGWEYLSSGHFIQATFENWESEFLQMGLYVFCTIYLFQKGSAESKKLDEPEEVDRAPVVHPLAPWPVKRGGFYLSVYQNSLSLVFAVLFMISFFVHAYGTMLQINEEGSSLSIFQTLYAGRFWFESLQNWQSEFLSVMAIVFFSIYLRQKGSPESKPVDAPHDSTGT